MSWFGNWFSFPFHFRSWSLRIFCPSLSTLASSHWPTVRDSWKTTWRWHQLNVGDCLGLSILKLVLLECCYESRPVPEFTKLIPSTIGYKIRYLMSKPCEQLYLKTQQERLPLVELRRLKSLSLGSGVSFRSSKNEIILPKGYLSGSRAKTTIWMDTIFMNDNPRPSPCTAIVHMLQHLEFDLVKIHFALETKRFSGPNKVFLKCKLDKVPAFFYHPNAHNCRCIFIKHELCNHSSGEMIGTYHREWKHRTRMNEKINC